MPDTIATPTRELAYLGAIAGNNEAPENPARLKEQILDQIAAKASVILVPEAGDSGKVLTAGADGTASWQTASSSASLFQHYRSETLPLTTVSAGTVDSVIDPGQTPAVPAIVFDGPFYAWTCDSISFGGNTYERTSQQWGPIGQPHTFGDNSYYVYVDTQGNSWRIEANNLDDIPAGTTVTFNGLDLAVSTSEDVAIINASSSISVGTTSN